MQVWCENLGVWLDAYLGKGMWSWSTGGRT